MWSSRLLCFVIITLVVCQVIQGHGRGGSYKQCASRHRPRNIGSKKFCKSLLHADGVLKECSKYFEKNHKKATLDWCQKLYRRYSGKAECEILQAFVAKCNAYDGHTNITEEAWRTEQDCPRPGVLITTPNKWSAGMEAQICIGFHNIHVDTDVIVVVQDRGIKVASVLASMPSSGCLTLMAPTDCDTKRHILAVNISNDYYSYNESTVISCKRRDPITFIQTDKPIYKPGQTVRFRIMSVTVPKLIPIIDDIARSYIETPGGTRVFQQDNITTTLGLAELEMQLDIHPPLGEWTIYVENDSGKHSKQFKIDKFVLPKWDVTVQAPALAVYTQEVVFVACALYTYGEAVQGTYTMDVSTAGYWSSTSVIDTTTFTGQLNSSGCVSVEVVPAAIVGFTSGNFIQALATVTETVSGIEREAMSNSVRIRSGDFKMAFDPRMTSYYKLGAPIFGQISVTSPNDDLVGENISLELVTSRGRRIVLYSINTTTDSDGSVEFVMPTSDIPRSVTSVYIMARLGKTTVTRYLKAWYSSGDSHVTVQPQYNCAVPCFAEHTFQVYHNATPGTAFHYILISKGHVALTGSINAPDSDITVAGDTVGYFNLDLYIYPTMAGETTMVIYYITDTLEFIADFMRFDVDQCFKNKVGFSFNQEKGEPGEEVTYTLTATSTSLCSIGVIDSSLEILAGNSFITKDQVFQFLNKLNLQTTSWQFQTDIYCENQDEDDEVEEPPMNPAYYGGCDPYTRYWSDYVDSSQTLNNLGVYVMSDLELQTRPCEKRTYYDCQLDSVDDYEDIPEAEEEQAQAEEAVDIRTFFPETFLWKLVVIGRSGSETESATLPDTITEWYGNAVCIERRDGLGISDFVSIVTFQTFFIQLNLPYSIVMDETVHFDVLLFNYLPRGECLAINVKLSAKDTFIINGAEEFTVCSCGQQSVSVEFIITPDIMGQIEITVVALTVNDPGVCKTTLSSITASDGVTRMLPVKADGIEIQYSYVRFLCAPATRTAQLALFENAVDESVRGRVSVIGDIMGPALSNLDGLIQRPMGCGEQTIFMTGQSAIVFKYLVTTGMATTDIELKALSSMRNGYQRELTFKHSNGAYSVWGPSGYGTSVGSNWLTAFVVRVFAMSDQFIFIDPSEQAASIAFLESGQDVNGCFPQVGTVIHKDMQGGLINSNQPIALTAFILISLLEGGVTTNSSSVVSAIGCLDSANIPDMSTYALAVSAYAYTLYESTASVRRHQILDELDDRATLEDGQKYWSSVATLPANWWRSNPPSFDVEMTSYALLAWATPGGTDAIRAGLPIARWLTAQRNAIGGWSSTQDTFVGLQAMSTYALLIMGDTLDLDVTFTPPGVTFHVDSSNVQLLQTEPLSSSVIPGDVDIAMTGSGCALVQVDVWYNARSYEIPEPYFDISIDVVTNGKCEEKILDMCILYLHADGPTNMALVQVKLVSGWIVDSGSLPQVATGGSEEEEEDTPGVITKIEEEKDTIIFYFNKITSRKSCFKFVVTQDVLVNNVKPGYVTVFDYYETDKTTSMDYKMECPSPDT